MTLLYCITDHVEVLSICINSKGVMPLLELKILKKKQFSTVFSYMLLHTALKFCIWLCFTVLQIKFVRCQFESIFVGVNPLLEFRILEIQFSTVSSYVLWYMLRWNFAYDFVLLYYRSRLSDLNLRQLLLELCPFWNIKYWQYTFFLTFLWHAVTYWADILHIHFYCTTGRVRVSSICVNICGSYALFGT